MDNLPNDPPDGNNNNSTPASPAGGPPPFGSNFNPHSNPQDPNNPYSHYHDVQSEIAKHRQRDGHGRFIPEPNQPVTPNSPNPSIPTIQVIHSNTNKASDPPLVDLKVTNPVTYLKRWVSRLLRNEGIIIRIKPLTVAIIILALTGGSFSIGSYLFPHSSPIFHRQVMYQGNLQRTDSGFFLTLPNSDLYTLRPKAKSNINFQSLTAGPALVKGNLTVEKFVIDVTEIIPLNTPTSPNTLTSPNTPTPDIELPKLYSAISWETAQKKILTFISGKRRIEQEGVYLESAKLNAYPYDFINYYINQLQDSGFKQTLNKIDPDGITTSFEKMGLYLTFGVKNIYSGSGESKKIVGYRAYLEHN